MIKNISLEKIKLFEFAPSISWFFFMTCPFFFQYDHFNNLGRSIQLISVIYVAVLFFICDFYCSQTVLPSDTFLRFRKKTFFDILSFGFIFLLIAHLCLMPSIPIFEVLFNTKYLTSYDIGVIRQTSSSLLEMPQFFKYFFNWLVVIFCPMSITYLFLTSRKKIAFLYLIFLIIYSVAATSKFPLVEFASSLTFITMYKFRKFHSLFINAIKYGLPLLLLGFIFLIQSGGINQKFILDKNYYKSSVSKFSANDPRITFSLADSYRSNYPYSDNKLDVNYFVYRAWLTPIDVSNRWFQFFYSTPIGFNSFWPFNRRADTFTSAQSVGIWAFWQKFPDRYLATVSANASFDADAFSRFGIWGVIFGPLIIVFFRAFSSILITKNSFSLMSYSIILSMLTVLPFISSIQAILGSHGLIIPMLIMMFFKLHHNYKKRS